MKKTIYTFVLGVFASTLAIAQDSTATKKDEGKFSVSGYIDSYYLHALNAPKSGNLMGAGANGATTDPNGNPLTIGSGRAFDRLDNQFALGLVQTKFSYINKKSELMVDLTFGPNAELGNFGNQRFMTPGGYATGFYPTNGNQSVLYNTSAAIKQAYFKYNITDKLSFTIGQFGTHIGYEVIDAPVNYNYSLSNLFNNGPFYHIGGKVNYAFSDKFGVMVGLVNNWDALTDWKKQKSVIAQVFVSPTSGFNIYVNYIGGYNDDGFKVPSGTGPGQLINGGTMNPLTNGYSINANYTRNLFDLTTGYQVSSKLYFGLNAAYGFYTFSAQTNSADSTASLKSEVQGAYNTDGNTLVVGWGGVALYSNYQFTDWLGLGVRYEHFDDHHRVRYICAVNNSFTITAPITLADGHLIIKPEFRADFSPQYYYENSKGQAVKNQQTIGCAFIYKY